MPEETNNEPTEPQQGNEPNPGGAVKTFTQEQVDAIMGQTRFEERAKFPDYEQLKARSKVADNLEQAQLSDKEKLERKAADAERKAIDADARAADTAIRSEIRLQAVQRGVVDPDAAYALIDRTGVVYTDDEGVKGVDTALEALLVEKPYLKGNPQPPPPNLNPGGGDRSVPVKLTDAQRESARRFGVSEEQYAKNLNPG